MRTRGVTWLGIFVVSVIVLNLAPVAWSSPARQTVPTRVRTTVPPPPTSAPPATSVSPPTPAPPATAAPPQPAATSPGAVPRLTDPPIATALPAATLARATNIAPTETRTVGTIAPINPGFPTSVAPRGSPTASPNLSRTASPMVNLPTSAPTATLVPLAATSTSALDAPWLFFGGAGLIVLGFILFFVRGRSA
ncbi:MAG: hypothetical protein HZC40_19820 [Chloroflexi bacterium]|nr:hypothetical protein [Chloroflexota bacterium]